MMGALTLAPASMADAALLLAWRNDPETRQQFFNADPVNPSRHLEWLEECLRDPHRLLMIAWLDGVAVGTIRGDFAGDGYALSWTVAPALRGRGIGKAIVNAMVDYLNAPVKAAIKAENTASQRIAEHAGMRLFLEQDGVLHYRK